VDAHLAEWPLDGGAADSPWTIYGTTIVAVLAAACHIVYLQLGDGDILIVDDAGAVTRPWPRDSRFLGVETASLCGPSPEDDLRLLIQPLDGSGPALVLLATDGYANSFREDAGFVRIGSDVLEIIRRDDTSNPEVGKRLAQELITREHVQLLTGVILSPVAAAIAPLTAEAKVPLLISIAAGVRLEQLATWLPDSLMGVAKK
jgi:hypothetical protein